MDDDAIHVGILLQQKRQELGLSVNEVSRLTGIRAAIIEAIEAGSFAVMPAVYMRSFIQRYARAVGVPQSELPLLEERTARSSQSRQRSMQTDHMQRPPSPVPPNARRAIAMFAAVGIAGIAAYVLFFSPTSSQQQGTSNIETPTETLRLAPPPTDTGGLLRYFGATRGEGFRLEAIARDTVWMSITIDGKQSEQLTLIPGQRRQWQALDAVVISVGNVGGVDFYRNGIKLTSLGGAGEVVRYVRITSRDVVLSTSSWARRRDSVLETLGTPVREQKKFLPQPTTSEASSATKNTAVSPTPQSTPRNQRATPQRTSVQRALQQHQITPVPPKAPLPSSPKPSSPD